MLNILRKLSGKKPIEYFFSFFVPESFYHEMILTQFVINVKRYVCSLRFCDMTMVSAYVEPEDFIEHYNVEVSCGPAGYRACTGLYDKPPHYTPAGRGDLWGRSSQSEAPS